MTSSRRRSQMENWGPLSTDPVNGETRGICASGCSIATVCKASNLLPTAEKVSFNFSVRADSPSFIRRARRAVVARVSIHTYAMARAAASRSSLASRPVALSSKFSKDDANCSEAVVPILGSDKWASAPVTRHRTVVVKKKLC